MEAVRGWVWIFSRIAQSSVVRVSCQIQWKMTKQQHLPTFPLILLNYVNLEITLEWNYFGQSKQYKVGKR